MDDDTLRGYYSKENLTKSTGTQTFHGGNVETFAAHFAYLMVAYLIAWKFVEACLPHLSGTWPALFKGMMFCWAFLAAMLVRLVIRKAGKAHLIDAEVLRRITGLGVEFFVLATIMGIQFSIVSKWAVPILITALLGGILTFITLFYFGARVGQDGNFERTIEMWGHATGTVPSGIALLRIVDPDFKTTTIMEVGLMNPVLVPTTIWLNFVISAPFTMGWSTLLTTSVLGTLPIVCVILLYVFKYVNKPTFSIFGKSTVKDHNISS